MSKKAEEIFEELFGRKEGVMEDLLQTSSEITKSSLAKTIKELLEHEKENIENPGKYDPRSLSIAKTEIESAVLLYIENKDPIVKMFGKENKDPIVKMFGKVVAKTESDIMDFVMNAKRWILNSENPEILKENIEDLKDVEVNETELDASALSGLFKAMKL